MTPRRVALFLLACAGTLLSSCGGISQVRVRSSPPGAVLYVNGVRHGTVPNSGSLVTLPWNEGERCFIQLLREGYAPVLKTFTEDQITGDTEVIPMTENR